MERDEDLLIAVINFLLQHGYPKESLVMEWPIKQRYRADLAVVDPDTNKAVALFEFKRRKTPESTKMALRQLETYTKAMGKEEVPTYVVFGKEGEVPFEIYHIEKGADGEEPLLSTALKKIPDFLFFKNSKFRKLIDQAEKQRKEAIDYFLVGCWMLAIGGVVLLIVDFRGLIQITAERLSLIFLVAVLFVIPFASKLKILGVEYERLKKKAEN
ncbi:MAG TPA: hypothetical protein VJB13_00020 [Candidatus Nanoarchaeia archaeon]|nr:hypothetical protein [Holosporales bacterium]HLD39513.1 hypothetical protein [Candidatus Nanoarchaeia archaeon]